MFDITRLKFSITGLGGVIASNGPDTIVFEEVDANTLRFDANASNVAKNWPHLPAVALASARAKRAFNRSK